MCFDIQNRKITITKTPVGSIRQNIYSRTSTFCTFMCTRGRWSCFQPSCLVKFFVFDWNYLRSGSEIHMHQISRSIDILMQFIKIALVLLKYKTHCFLATSFNFLSFDPINILKLLVQDIRRLCNVAYCMHTIYGWAQDSYLLEQPFPTFRIDQTSFNLCMCASIMHVLLIETA